MREYRNADIFCLTSFKESEGASTSQAMAAGLPIIRTRTGGSELVGYGGVIVGIGDVDWLAAALTEFMDNEWLRVQTGLQARNEAEERRAATSAKAVLEP